MKIGITGAAGNIGMTLRQGLSKEYSFKLFDIKNIKTNEEFKMVNLSKKEQVSGIFDGLDVVIHVAGDARLNASEKSAMENNFIATSNVFEEAKNAEVKKIIFASSNWYHEGDIRHALSAGNSRLITLDRPSTAYCPYARSKVYGENIGQHMSFMGVQFVALRIGWTIPEDTPVIYDSPYMRAMFCSKRDLVQAFEKSIKIGKNFLTAFAISNNDRRIFDLEGTRAILGYDPLDNSEKYF
jgi:NAD+ dependent glucose-6-phosphate dehydrogenase